MYHESLAFGGTHPPRNFQESMLPNTRVPPEKYRDGGDKLNTDPPLGLADRHTVCRGRKVNNTRDISIIPD